MSDIISPYLWAIFVAWLVAHGIKSVLNFSQARGRGVIRQLFISGGMPSSHAATTVAVWTVVLIKDGPQSGLFGLATLVAMIVCYDAIKVRRSVGEQGIAIIELIEATKSKVKLPRAARGHTPVELVVGALLGVLIGLVVYLATT
ncbi:MAG: divergent PAP2 family protein [Candidatus Saccharimonas sp.]